MTTPKRAGTEWTEDDFRPVPSVDGAYRHPVEYGRIVYTAERDYLIHGPERRGPFRRLLERCGLKARPQAPVHGGRPGIKAH